MKKYLFIVLLLAALVFLPGSSVWEGAAAVSVDFPESGFYVATNSFPRNTVVDLTNLETGRTVRVIVAAGLDTPGLLALISREAAEAVGLRSRTIGRIRMVAPSDPIAFSRFSENYRSGDPDYDPQAAVERVYGSSTVFPTSPANDTSIRPDSPLRNEPEGAWTPESTTPVQPSAPAEERPPQSGTTTQSGTGSQFFSVPVVFHLEQGKYYLQIGAYELTASVERELSKIGRSYPLTVQLFDNLGKPTYRILIGPVTQAEAGTFLRRFQAAGYKDAFVRRG